MLPNITQSEIIALVQYAKRFSDPAAKQEVENEQQIDNYDKEPLTTYQTLMTYEDNKEKEKIRAGGGNTGHYRSPDQRTLMELRKEAFAGGLEGVLRIIEVYHVDRDAMFRKPLSSLSMYDIQKFMPSLLEYSHK